ncbi:hypothetical protein ACFQRB_18245 [Halobaculum litoreum]|uniref:Uncharacterized protein n=1 Tax=Halobaculum litoreum TaxID=3031998 RepID=A0ABD5XW25_9EURY
MRTAAASAPGSTTTVAGSHATHAWSSTVAAAGAVSASANPTSG